MNQGIIRARHRVHEYVPLRLVFDEVIPKARDCRFVLLHNLTILLEIVQDSYQMNQSEEPA